MNKETKINDIKSEAARLGWYGYSVEHLVDYVKETMATDCQFEITDLKLRATRLETRIQQIEENVTMRIGRASNQRGRIGLWDMIQSAIDRRTVAKLNPLIREYEVQLAVTLKEIECVIEGYAAEASELEKMAEFEHFLAKSASESQRINTHVEKKEDSYDVLV